MKRACEWYCVDCRQLHYYYRRPRHARQVPLDRPADLRYLPRHAKPTRWYMPEMPAVAP